MTRLKRMASNSSKNIDHGNYVPSAVAPGLTIEDGGHLRRLYVLAPDGLSGLAAGETAGQTGIQFSSPANIPAHFILGADASLDLTVIVLPGISASVPLTIDLTGEHSEVRLSGIYLCGGKDEVSFDITMHHRRGGCTSSQTFNGLAADEARCGFFGKIVIAPDAQRTEACQENHNILLSESARVNTKPRLEIYADDVKCSHGATVGKLNEDEQFYMRSRGIPEEEAKVLQMISFVAPVLESIPEETTDGSPCRSTVADLVENAIRSL